MPGSTARPTFCPGEARPRSRKSRRSRPRPLTCGTSATPGTTRLPGTIRHKRLENQEVVLTVPASFDEAARELTIEAAKRAELATITLLEEPQAAFYCWIVSHQDRWQREVRAGELILVCDIGGGTTDFSLITVVETPTGPGLSPRRRRRSPDARRRQHRPRTGASRREEARGRAARHRAVECACGSPAGRPRKSCWASSSRRIERWPVTIAGRGSKLIGGSIQSELTRAEVEAIALDGFFPRVTRGEDPARAAKSGLQEFGLPFVADPAVPRHLELLPAPASGRGDRAGGPPAGGPARAARRDPLQRRGAHARDRPPTGSSR